MRLLLFTFLLSALSFGQDRNGISYQALIINPNVEQLPGQDNDHSPLTNTDICLQFHIISSSGNYEYSESQSVTTDAYGMVNLVIGTGTPIGAITWDAVAWSAEAKSLKVDLDITGACTSFTELSNQQLTSVPFALYSPSSNVPGPKGDPGDPGADGDSAYQVWLDEGNTGTEQDFLDSLKGTDGTPGDPGADGDSAYQVWLDAGNTGTEQEFLDSLKGTDGTPGDPGADGDSAYQVWLDAGNTGTEQEFLDSLKGADGDPGQGTEGKSAYDIWIELGNTGTEQDFIDSLIGPQGSSGGNNSVENLPTDVIILENNVLETVSFIVPENKYAKITGVLMPPGENSFIQGISDETYIGINGVNYQIERTTLGAGDYNSSIIRGDFWVPPSSVISIPDIAGKTQFVGRLFINLYTNLNFEPKVITTATVVPEGKLWKVSSVLLREELEFRTNTFGNTTSDFNVKISINNAEFLVAEMGNGSSSITNGARIFLSNNEYWLPAGTTLNIGKNLGAISILEYDSSSSSTNTETPPSTLQVGDEWGGGIVFYIAQQGDPIYVEGEIHGLIAPQNWESNNGQVINVYNTAYRTWYEDNPEFTSTGIGDGYLNTEKQYLLQYQYSDSPYNEYSAVGVCYNAEINGYTDWYLPNSNEIWKLRDFQNSSENRDEINFPSSVDTYWISGYSLRRGQGNSPIYRVNIGSTNRNNGSEGYDYQVKPIRKF